MALKSKLVWIWQNGDKGKFSDLGKTVKRS